ncbi:DEKNAAC104410 [Brettanomyces naardenensis]|uniref:DEKNAAC104410 n=1 Tax=Brettanomyces naardenensis TaxID=13370 RepID=A0A448YQT7_BRENA|nr:DEKNAAC104410 [Brettanomyces naardenensis]
MLSLLLLPLLSLTSASPVADPLAEALGFAKPDDASYDCHSYCGNAIIQARKCSPDGNTDGDYDSSCLCSSGSGFLALVPDCLACGWCLWDDYGSFLTSALAQCNTDTQPTGTECAPSSSAISSSQPTDESTTEPTSEPSSEPTSESTAESTSEEPTSNESSAAPSSEAASSAPEESTASAESVSTTEASSSASAVQTFTGGANKVAVGAAGILGAAVLLM